MNEKHNINEILTEAFRKNETCAKEFGPDFSKVEQGALSKYKQRSKKHRIVLMARIAAIIVVSLLLLNCLMLFTDVKPVQAYRAEVKTLFFNLFNNDTNIQSEDPIKRMSNKIENIQKQVPFQIPAPAWIPDGYKFDNAQMTSDGNGTYVIYLNYVAPSGNKKEMLQVQVTNDDTFASTPSTSGDKAFEKITVSGYDVYLTTNVADDFSHFYGMFFDKHGLFISVSCTGDKQSILKIIGSID